MGVTVAVPELERLDAARALDIARLNMAKYMERSAMMKFVTGDQSKHFMETNVKLAAHLLALALSASFAGPSLASVSTPITGDSSYVLTFDEEFNGTAIDKTKWQVTFDGNADRTYSTYPNAQFWNSTNLTVVNGVADFAVTKCPTGYCTAGITSFLLQTYGYWEARVKLPANAAGIGANFWTDAKSWVFPENDIIEWSGSTPATYRANWHNGASWVSVNTVSGADTNFHVVGMLWTPTTITWYLDGVQKAQVPTNGAGAVPQWTLLVATVGPFGNLIGSSTVFPAHYQVDYVHIYSNSPTAVAVTPQANYGGPGDNGSTTTTTSTTSTTTTTSSTTILHGRKK